MVQSPDIPVYKIPVRIFLYLHLESLAIFICKYPLLFNIRECRGPVFIQRVLQFCELCQKKICIINIFLCLKSEEIVFYCAWPQEHTAAGQAAKYNALGYLNAKALGGGVAAWQKAGYPLVEEK